MSTVIFYNGSLYADTQCTHREITSDNTDKVDHIVRITTTRKLFRLKENCCNPGAILGCVGAVAAQTDFINWIDNSRSPKSNYTLLPSFNALEYDGEILTSWKLVPAGKRWIKLWWWFWWRCNVYKFVISSEHKYTIQNQLDGYRLTATIGSGGEYAAGYLYAKGSKPFDAFDAAEKYDPYTNNLVETTGLFIDGVNIVSEC